MINSKSCAIIYSTAGGRLICPTCRAKLIRILPDTEAANLQVFCRKCKTELKIDIKSGQCFKSQS